MTSASAPAVSRPATRGPLGVLEWVLASAIVVVAVASGVGVIEPIAIVVGLTALAAGSVLGWLALYRFELFVLVVFGIRPAIDSVKFAGRSASVFDATALLSLGLIAGGLAWWYATRDDGRTRAVSPVHAALVVLMACMTVVAATSLRPAASAAELIRLGSIAAMFLILERMLRTDQDVTNVLKAVVIGSLVPIVVGLVGWLAAADFVLEEKAGISRLTSTFTQSNSYSRYLMLLILGAVAVRHVLRGNPRLVADVVILAAGVSLLLTGTRASQIATVAGVLVIGWLDNSKVIAVAMLVCASIAMLAPWALEPIASSFEGSDKPAVVDEPGDSLSWRLFYWQRILPLAKDHPASGIGLGSTVFVAEGHKEPHSDVVRVVVEGGALGIVGYGAMLIGLTKLSRRALRRTAGRTDLHRGIAVGFAGSSVTLLLVSLVSNVMTEVPAMWTYMTFAALAAYVARANGEEPTSVPSSADVGSELPTEAAV